MTSVLSSVVGTWLLDRFCGEPAVAGHHAVLPLPRRVRRPVMLSAGSESRARPSIPMTTTGLARWLGRGGAAGSGWRREAKMATAASTPITAAPKKTLLRGRAGSKWEWA